MRSNLWKIFIDNYKPNEGLGDRILKKFNIDSSPGAAHFSESHLLVVVFCYLSTLYLV